MTIITPRVSQGKPPRQVDPARAEWLVRYLAVRDELESLWHATGDALGLDDADEMDRVLLEVGELLKDNQPRLRAH